MSEGGGGGRRDTRRPEIALAVPVGVRHATDRKEIELILMLDATRCCNHKDIWRPSRSLPSTDIFMVKAWPRDAIGATAARSSESLPFPGK